MIARRSVLGLLAGGAAAAGLGGCGLLNSRASYRFRMTVEANTPQGVVRASSVYEVRAEKNNTRIMAEEWYGATTIRGEAVVLDLPDGPLFVLLKVPESESLARAATQALKPDAELGGIDNFLPAVRALGRPFAGARAELLRRDWPLMVRFADIADPASVERVDPETAGIFSIMLETTRDPVTTGIEKKIPWLPNVKTLLGGRDDFKPEGIPLGNFTRLFSTELKK
jgi:hypothetical protein